MFSHHVMHIMSNAWMSESYFMSLVFCFFVLLADVNIWYIPLLKVQLGFIMTTTTNQLSLVVHPPTPQTGVLSQSVSRQHCMLEGLTPIMPPATFVKPGDCLLPAKLLDGLGRPFPLKANDCLWKETHFIQKPIIAKGAATLVNLLVRQCREQRRSSPVPSARVQVLPIFHTAACYAVAQWHCCISSVCLFVCLLSYSFLLFASVAFCSCDCLPRTLFFIPGYYFKQPALFNQPHCHLSPLSTLGSN